MGEKVRALKQRKRKLYLDQSQVDIYFLVFGLVKL